MLKTQGYRQIQTPVGKVKREKGKTETQKGGLNKPVCVSKGHM